MNVKELRAFLEGKADDVEVKIDMVPNFQISLVEPKVEEKLDKVIDEAVEKIVDVAIPE